MVVNTHWRQVTQSAVGSCMERSSRLYLLMVPWHESIHSMRDDHDLTSSFILQHTDAHALTYRGIEGEAACAARISPRGRKKRASVFRATHEIRKVLLK